MRKRILLVDDEPQLLFAIQEYLSRVGYEVAVAESGEEALNLLVESPPDVIISDILMEGMDGFEFQRRVSALTGDSIPFIFLTAKGDLEDRLTGLRGGADDYITKPFEPEELEARIATVLKRVEHTRHEERREIENLRSRILARVASELRAPVTSLVAHMNLLLTERFGENEGEKERYLHSVLEDARLLSRLVNDLSWAASDIGGEITLKREPLRIAPIVRGSAAIAARIANEKGITLRISCGGLLSGIIDGAAMSRALSGLLEAAVKLSPPGSQVSITATRAREGGLEFIITDGGCERDSDQEIASEWADSLSFAKQVVKGHGGQLSIRREPDGSQSILIWVPGRIAKHVGRRK